MNLIAWIISAVIYLALGFIWYRIFEKTWLEEINKTKEDVKFTFSDYIGTVVTALLITFVEGVVIEFFHYALVDIGQTMNALFGLLIGLTVWVGFIGAVGMIQILYKNRSGTLFLIDYGYHLIGLIIGGLLMGGWFF
ncbi:MAG: DUF1761 family protein [Candidatus Lokiarchaeota archaeon]|nr:DUF1761 family protein [Candidatus Lokiarchaeota archaeon]